MDDSDAWVHPTLQRFLRFEFSPHLWKGRYAVWLQAALVGGLFLYWHQRVWFSLCLLIAGIVGIVCTYVQAGRFRRWVVNAVPVKVMLVIANERLFNNGSMDAPCLVLFSLQSGYTSNLTFLHEVAERIRALEGTNPENPDLQWLADIMEGKEFTETYRRRLVPASLTNGVKVYLADLQVERRALWKGKLTHPVLHCMVEPGDTGRIELIPWQVVAGE